VRSLFVLVRSLFVLTKEEIFGGMSGKREIYLHNSEKSCTFAGKIDIKGNKTMLATNLSQTATQMIVNIDDRSIVNDIRREFYQDLDAAEQDIAYGKGVRVSSKQELDALFA